ncbi:hypothetical protein [Methylophaga thalassica]|uniref:hypothetical protein n=1 Tax=Methylophaga thalassica TaxID=40223 RepID=UPI002E7AC32D|nr:hypothetical protein [Methylophaga thalassica]WVI83894.1 hypothetical protein VSX76_00660 [Methylophaga thalassica]
MTNIKLPNMTSNTTPIDLNAYKRFLDGEVEKHASDTKINNGTSIVNAVNVGSYSFSWGKIVEQLSGEFFIWKFQISTLARKSDGERIYYQQQIFNYLQSKHPEHSSEHAILVAGLHDKCIFLGIKDDAFIIASPMQHEYKNRIWVHMHILKKDIPEILSNINNT